MQMYKVMMLPMAEEDIMIRIILRSRKKHLKTALELAMGFRNTIAKLEFMPKQHELDEDEELHLLMVDNHIPAGAKLY